CLPAFTRIGNQLILKPVLKDGDVITLIYYKLIQHAQNITDSPPHFKKGPDVMLYLSLRHASLFLRDNDMGQYWEQKAQEAVAGLQAKIESERWNGSTIVIPGK
ncbi:phage adaptor protein, partial [Herbiconiux daphne]